MCWNCTEGTGLSSPHNNFWDCNFFFDISSVNKIVTCVRSYPTVRSYPIWQYPMDQSEISQNIRTSEVISHEAKPSVISLHEWEYFWYLTMNHAISVLSYGLITCSLFPFAIKAQNFNNFEWYSQLNLENSRLNAMKPQLILF